MTLGPIPAFWFRRLAIGPESLAVARHTNITLVSLDELRKAARGELLFLGLLEIQRRAMRMKDYVFSLWRTERHEKGFSTSKPRPGIDGKLATTIGGTVSIIGTGAERALLGTFPAPLRFLEDVGNTLVGAKDLEEFVVSASEILDSLDVLLADLEEAGRVPSPIGRVRRCCCRCAALV